MAVSFEVLDKGDDVVAFLTTHYGPGYKPGVVEAGLWRITRVLGLRDYAGALAAVATIDHGRIVAATADSSVSPQERVGLAMRLMMACYEDGVATWITVGEQHTSIIRGLGFLGMQRVNDADVAARLIESLDLADDAYVIAQDEAGLTLVSGAQSTTPGYRQQVWMWADRPLAEPADPAP